MGKSDKKKPARPAIPERQKLLVWAAAAGRCTFCNRLVTENEDLGEAVPIGELAHNVGWGGDSPRGDSDLTPTERSGSDNLLLLCRNCHKPADDSGVVGRYGVEELRRLKREHEERIRLVTGVGGDRTAVVIRVVGSIRQASPELTFDTVLAATTQAGLFPVLIPGAYRHEIEVDLRGLPNEGSLDYFKACAAQVDDLASRINDGIRRDEIQRLAVFGFARIPVLAHLGSRLDDKVLTVIFQRQRVDDANAWKWPSPAPSTPSFVFETVHAEEGSSSAAVILNLSGVIHLDDLPAEVVGRATVYVLRPDDESYIGPNLISSAEALKAFEQSARQLLAHLEGQHGRLERLPIFMAVPLSAAIVVGRVLMPNVSPILEVHDRDAEGRFFKALEVQR